MDTTREAGKLRAGLPEDGLLGALRSRFSRFGYLATPAPLSRAWIVFQAWSERGFSERKTEHLNAIGRFWQGK